jgi:hypothetical protein
MQRRPTPPVRKGRQRSNARAAQRRVFNSGRPTGPAPRDVNGNPVVPAVEPGPATHTQQPVSAPKPRNVLGGQSGVKGDSYLPGQQVNKGMPEAAVTGGGERIGKRFTVGFDRAGNIVHLYGSDVPADQRRQVLKKRA